MASFDYKKEYPDLYRPKTTPVLIDVPAMSFIMVDGRGNPNTCEAYKAAMEVLYGLSYSIKMSKMSGAQPEGYFEYVVPPLEGLWSVDDEGYDGTGVIDKDRFCWTSMIRQPDFVTPAVFEQAKQALAKKKPGLDLSAARLEVWREGLCAQVMHLGPYDDEPATIETLNAFVDAAGYRNDLDGARRHHEIYLGDPRRVSPERLKTVIRHPVAK